MVDRRAEKQNGRGEVAMSVVDMAKGGGWGWVWLVLPRGWRTWVSRRA